MLYYVIHNEGEQNITVLRVSNVVLQRQGIFVTDGIASNKLTRIYSLSEGLETLQAQQEMLQSDLWTSWSDSDKVRRQLMAECLVPNQVNPGHIQQFIVSDQSIANSLQNRLSVSNFRKCVVASDRGVVTYLRHSKLGEDLFKFTLELQLECKRSVTKYRQSQPNSKKQHRKGKQ